MRKIQRLIAKMYQYILRRQVAKQDYATIRHELVQLKALVSTIEGVLPREDTK